MVSSEVQRTLVKSPPELWAEISDPESLARHLGEFGEIRITHVKPEQKVEWEAGNASGTVVIKPSGWGTKVKLTVTRELAVPEPTAESAAQTDREPDDEQPSAQAPEQAPEQPAQQVELERDAADSAAVEREPQDVTELDDELEPDTEDAAITGSSLELESPTEPDSRPEAHEETERDEEGVAHAAAEPEPRRGFFARLFGRRRKHVEEPSPIAIDEPAAEPIEDEPPSAGLEEPEHDFELVDQPVIAPEPATSAVVNDLSKTVAQPLGELASKTATLTAEQTINAPEDPADESPQQDAPDEATTQTKLAEELAAEEVTAVLTGVLDRLGAAHHRPFSRA
jgi:hypothetical protein